jgi:thiol-disulfide isomerase/thioredoxin
VPRALRPERLLAAFALAASLALAGGDRPAAAAAAAPPPDFTATDLHGIPRRLSKLRGRVTVVAFWATWCFPCRFELPLLERLYRENRDDGLQVVAVATDDQLDAVRRYVAEQGFSFTVLFDAGGASRRRFGADSVPATFLLDARGEPVPLLDPATGRSAILVDNPLIWSDQGTLQRIEGLLRVP